MQEMTQPICYHAEIGETRQLFDVRDGKVYWIAKLKDGNCWMVQNLDYDVPSSINDDYSDVSSLVTTDITKITSLAQWAGSDPAYNAYYDPGNYYYSGENGNYGNSTPCSNSTGLNDCPNFSTSGDSHYHIGNYYSWTAATVKTGNNLTQLGDQATSSICPKGWRLPMSGYSVFGAAPWNNNKTFARLLESYGYQWNQGYYSDNLSGGTKYYIYNMPFYFTYGGYLNNGGLVYAGGYGLYWSSTFASNTTAFDLSLYTTITPAEKNDRYYGFSVRCVAK